ncbi:MAG: right-handed parallel beta-helix repeat-containing protein [Candidatus Eisenbacteria sp.]|nr:right-handed parallel beta-helix repeat-containing protein [Candidatus Eisenbacteria bacterium]
MSRHRIIVKQAALLVVTVAALTLCPSGAMAVKQVSGNIWVDTVWDTVGGRIYEVTGSVAVQSGATLRIDPGVVVKFNLYRALSVYGTLYAVGGNGPDSTIYFTSIRDDNIPPPLGDDTNGDGNATLPANQNWNNIYFYSTAEDTSRLEHCELWFGGYSSNAIIVCEDASPTIENCVVNAGYYGIKCTGPVTPTIRNTDINACTSVPLAITIDADPVFDAVTFGSTSDNGYDAIGLLPTTLSSDATLYVRGTQVGGSPIPNVTYLLLGDITVNAGATLTIDPGIVTKFLSASVDIFVNGGLVADGKSDSLIVFTSFKDDNYGDPNDTNNDGSTTAPASGDWGGLVFGEGSSGTIDYCVVKYGGYGTYNCLVRTYNTGTDVSFTNSEFSDAQYGLEIAGLSDPAVTDNTLAFCTYTPILMSVSADPVFSGNTFVSNGVTALGLISETVGVNSLIRRRDVAGYENITYYLVGNLTMDLGAVLTVDPDVVIKFKHAYTSIIIEGGLRAEGTPDSMVVFTSWRDDTHGNPADTNDDGSATVPNHSDWGHIQFVSTAIDTESVLQHCWIGYGGYDGYGAYEGTVWCSSSSPAIDQCTFYTNRVGVRCDGNSEALVTDNFFFNHYSVPIHVSVLSNPTFTGNTFDQNAYHAVGIISETLSENATLEVSTVGIPQFPEPFPYFLVQGALTIGTDVIMTIDPDVVVKCSSYGIIVHGGLIAEPGPILVKQSPVVFTDIKDDSHGGDSNVDGSATGPTNADWPAIEFYPTADDANCRLENCLFWYGGSSAQGVIHMENASPSITNCSFEFNGIGIWIEGLSNPTITGNLIRQSTREPVAVDVLCNPTFSGNSFDANGMTALGIIGGYLAQDATLPVRNVAGYNNITYILGSNLTVQFGATLTIAPGIVVKMQYSSPFYIGELLAVNGGLLADGEELSPIVFTSLRDDTYGNPLDTNGDGALTSPSPGSWNAIGFYDVSVDTLCLLDHCILRYGDRYGYGAVYVESASPTLSNSTIEHGYYYGLRLAGVSEPIVENCDFVDNGRTPIAMTLLSNPVTTGNEFIGNGYTALGIIGETLAQDVTWITRNVGQIENIPYVLLSNMTVGTGAILTLQPGLVIKFYSGIGLYVKRGLIAEGKADPESLIVFTSTTDDFYGGDTNGDSTDTNGFSSRWGWMDIQSTALSPSVRFRNCVFSYSYNYSSYGAVIVKGSVSPSFDNCIFAHNTVGINYQQASGDPAIGEVDSCDFFDNSSYAIRNTGMAHTVSAEYCWWGDNSGPYDPSDDTGTGGLYNPTGLGDPVTDMVDYMPWAAEGLENYLLGDVSLNGAIHAWDASLVLRWLVADTTLTAQQQVIGDVTCAAGLSALDASYILQYVAGLIPYFPCMAGSIATKDMIAFDDWPGMTPGDFDISLDSFDLEPGTEVTVPIRLTGSGDVYSAQFTVRSNSEAVRILGIAQTPEVDGSAFYSTLGEDGVARIALASTTEIPVAPLATLTLAISEDIPEDARVTVAFDRAWVNEQDLTSRARPARGLVPGRLPAAFALEQNIPNPFNPSTTIQFAIPKTVHGPVPASLKVFDAKGRLIRVLLDEPRPAGVHSVFWDGRNEHGAMVASGVYFYRLTAGAFSGQRKMVLLK